MALHCLQGEDQTTYHGIQSPSQTVAASLSRVIPTQPRAEPPLRLPHPPNSRPVFHLAASRSGTPPPPPLCLTYLPAQVSLPREGVPSPNLPEPLLSHLPRGHSPCPLCRVLMRTKRSQNVVSALKMMAAVGFRLFVPSPIPQHTAGHAT